MHRLAMLLVSLGLGASTAHAAATQWVPTCGTRDENTVWFVLSSEPPKDDKAGKKDEKKDAGAAGGAAAAATPAPAAGGEAAKPWTANPDFSCVGLFFDNVPCTNAVVIGKIMQVGLKVLEPVFELRYVPAGETANILSFLDRTGPNVLYDGRNVPTTTSSPPTREALFKGWLEKWRTASGATQGVTIHLWICPEGEFSPPDEEITPYGMSVTPHFGRAPT